MFKLAGCRIRVSNSFPKCCFHYRGNLRAYRYPWVAAITQSITLSRGTLLRARCSWQLWVKPAVFSLGVSECFTLCHPCQAPWRSHYETQYNRGADAGAVDRAQARLIARAEWGRPRISSLPLAPRGHYKYSAAGSAVSHRTPAAHRAGGGPGGPALTAESRPCPDGREPAPQGCSAPSGAGLQRLGGEGRRGGLKRGGPGGRQGPPE